MRRSSLLFLVVTAFVTATPVQASGTSDVTVAEVIQSGSELDGERITVEGELIGDYGFRDDGWMWTQLNGDAYVSDPIGEGGSPVGGNTGIGIRMPTHLGDDLDPPGRYRNRGPIVRATGIWTYHDPGRQGESYLKVESLSVIEAGRRMPQEADWLVMIAGLSLVTGAAVLWLTLESSNVTRPFRRLSGI